MDTLTTQQRSERMRRVRSRDTAPEIALRRFVWSLGHRYRIHRRDVPGTPDIAFLGRKRAIFLHGCFWHRHDCGAGRRTPKSRLDFWTSKFESNVRRDRVVQAELDAIGWRSLVVWECELKDMAGLEPRIREFLDA